ncbi:hypothetical protein KGF54_004265 [Candida jiufengensis]|uniref:uncharacterized protein n=1 Tax=Candida jiufengensis TaxID=497108 RepID=UPI002224B691|nr:uncharacterized protein KGF54_004265 [Candida jiufengensis]KAI5951191.1 hypothetical protein KGF54_004265 [Candida jiufengensis]
MFGKDKEDNFSIDNYEFLPGTVHLVDVTHSLNVRKNGNDGDGDIILHPQPTSNPNDPLNWSTRKRTFQFGIIWFWGFMVAGSLNFMTPLYSSWISSYGITLNQLLISSALGYLFLGVGVTLVQPTGLKLGKQFVYNCCTVIAIISCGFGSKTSNISYIYAYKALIGIAAAPCDSLVEVSSTDIFFQHERSTAISWLLMALYGGTDLFPVAAGYVADSLPWTWCYYIQIFIYGGLFLVQLFFMEDTTFRRGNQAEAELEEGILNQIKSYETIQEQRINSRIETDEKKPTDSEEIDVQSVSNSGEDIPKKTYLQKRNWIHTEYNDVRSWIQIFIRPFYLITFPAVVWSGLIYGGQMCWLSLLINLSSSIYSKPPYNFSDGVVGLTSLGIFVGNVVGMFYGGTFVDWLSIKLATRNHGILEPEHRLQAMLVPTVLNAAGILAFGLSAHYGASYWVSIIIGMGFMGFAMTSSGTICVVYAVDSYEKLASESIVLMLFIRNMIGMAFTFGIGPWIDEQGIFKTTWVMFGLSIFINGSYLVMIKYGKACRRWTRERYERVTQEQYFNLSASPEFQLYINLYPLSLQFQHLPTTFLSISTMSEMHPQSLFILGSTGLVGTQVTKYALLSKHFNKVVTLTRSVPDFATPENSPKLDSIVNKTTEEWGSVIEKLPEHPKAYISSFGTTRAKAGSAENFKKIDYGINYECAKAAKSNGATTCVLVSAMGADAKSPFLYMKTKGELEDAIKALDFQYTIILRPGVLIGDRKDNHGFGNSLAMTVGRWTKGTWFSPLTRAIDASDVGKIAIDFAERGLKGDLRESVLIVGGAELVELVEDLKVV